MNTQPKPPARPLTPARAAQLKAATGAVPKTNAVSKSTQPCAKPAKSDWSCLRYGKLRGPAYNNKTNKQPISGYRRWHSLIDSQQITEGDAKTMLLMSPNEGDFNAVQAYDNQALTMGAMQKTIAPDGKGELTDQMVAFKARKPDKYKTVFQDQGWDTEEVEVTKTVGKGKKKKTITTTETRAKYTYTNSKGEQVTIGGDKLYAFIKSYCDPNTDAETKAEVEKALDAMRKAGEDDEFKDQQIIDFKKRIDKATGTKPKGYDYPIADYMTSDKGRALALDQSVNRPAYLSTDYGSALDTFYKNNPKVSKNPADWGENRETYQDEINSIYGPARRGTDMKGRYERIRDAPNPVVPADTPPS
ncbi:EF hand domain protein [Fibrella aestuarina BUZ 2]|uniref:EF hand domain protein n=1 Tax=Fibrella aestuarina BUZ 2 TaxID=1166018 RepID=I0KGF9_9BACT|nr:hypothetical protein [Fibrella aestuarina]CCH03212.1 EF hand domain protein [Fibrella aestuarina BUZ 2]